MDKAIEKLGKSFEALRSISVVFPDDKGASTLGRRHKDQGLSAKDRITHCHAIADMLLSSSMKNHPDYGKYFSQSFDTFLSLCNDSDADVRLVADSCLNRVIKQVLLDSNATRVQVELYKEMKRNGPARSLRAALMKFAQLAHRIRPTKARIFAVSLVSCVITLSKRPEDGVQECLGGSIDKIWPYLGPYFSDEETKALIKAFLPNLNLQSLTSRRVAAASLTVFCRHSRKSQLFTAYLMKSLLDQIVPIPADQSTQTLLGVLFALKQLTDIIDGCESPIDYDTDKGASSAKLNLPSTISSEQLLQLYEVCLFYCCHSNGSICAAALELLLHLLKKPPESLRRVLMNPTGIDRTRIYRSDQPILGRSRSRKSSFVGRSGLSSLTGSQSDLTAFASGDLAFNVDQAEEPPIFDEPFSPDESSTSEVDAVGSEAHVGQLSSKTEQGDGTPNIPGAAAAVRATRSYSSMQIGDLDENGTDMGSVEPPVTNTGEPYPSNQAYELLDPLGALPVTDADVSDQSSMIEDWKKSSEDAQTRSFTRPLTLNSLERVSPISETLAVTATSPTSPTSPVSYANGDIRLPNDIGDFTDEDVSLIYCCRLLCARFLLTGMVSNGELIPDRDVRVSHKAIALACLDALVALKPDLIGIKLLRIDSSSQGINDVLLYAEHNDPQLRGLIAELIGTLLVSIKACSANQISKWVVEHLAGSVSVERVVQILSKLIHDEAATACRASLSALSRCWHCISSVDGGGAAIDLLTRAIRMASSPYWLTKVELADFLGGIDFCELAVIEMRMTAPSYLMCQNIQDKTIETLIQQLLCDPDDRVKAAAASAITRCLPRLCLYGGNSDPLLSYGNNQLSSVLSSHDLNSGNPIHENRNGDWSLRGFPLVHGMAPYFEPAIFPGSNDSNEGNLSFLLSRILEQMFSSTTRHQVVGCIYALTCLAESYPPSQYRASWLGTDVLTQDNEIDTSGCGLAKIFLHYLQSTPLIHDFAVHQYILKLLTHLYTGICVRSMLALRKEHQSKWSIVDNPTLKELTSEMFIYCLKFLNVCWNICTEHTVHGTTSASVASTIATKIPNLAPGSFSPVKPKLKSAKSSTAATDDATAAAAPPLTQPLVPKLKYGDCSTSIQFMKLAELFRGCYANFKISITDSAGEKFLSLIRSCLSCLSHLLEVTSLADTSKYTEELLLYLKTVGTLAPSDAFICVQQVLKSLFGTNLTMALHRLAAPYGQGQTLSRFGGSHRSSSRLPVPNLPSSLYQTMIMKPYTQLTQDLAAGLARHELIGESIERHLGWMKLRSDRHVLQLLRYGSEKSQLTSYIRMFEPVVIQALKLYTNSNQTGLQNQVIHLLIQLIQVRVNYGLLDADLRFLKFLFQQLEEMEEGQLRFCQVMIRSIFEFLVVLSYERGQSGLVVEVPKIIQLIDGLMAVCHSAEQVVIPALHTVTMDLYLIRPGLKVDSVADLETQKEVVRSLIMKYCHNYQAVELLCFILYQTKLESIEKWRKLSRDIIDLMIPVLFKFQLRISNQPSLTAMNRLLELICPSALRPLDAILNIMFAVPSISLASIDSFAAWLSLQYICLNHILLNAKEDALLSRIEALQYRINITSLSGDRDRFGGPPVITDDSGLEDMPSPHDIVARLLLTICELSANEIYYHATTLPPVTHDHTFDYVQMISFQYIQLVCHIAQSGCYRKIKASFREAIISSSSSLASSFGKISTIQPLISLLWANIYPVLHINNAESLSLMICLVQPNDKAAATASLTLVKYIGSIIFADFAKSILQSGNESGNLHCVNSLTELLVELCQEPPVEELLTILCKDDSAVGLFAGALMSNLFLNWQHKPGMMRRFLICLDGLPKSYLPALIYFLIIKIIPSHFLTIGNMARDMVVQRLKSLESKGDLSDMSTLTVEQFDKMIGTLESPKLLKRTSEIRRLMLLCRQECYPDERGLRRSDSTDRDGEALIAGLPMSRFNKMKYVQLLKAAYSGNYCSANTIAKLICQFSFEEAREILCNEVVSPSCIMACFLLGIEKFFEASDAVQSFQSSSELYSCHRPINVDEQPLLGASRVAVLGSIRQCVRGMASKSSKSARDRTVTEWGPMVTVFLEHAQQIRLIPDPELENVVKFVTLYLETIADGCQKPEYGLLKILNACSCLSAAMACTKFFDELSGLQHLQHQMNIIGSLYRIYQFVCSNNISNQNRSFEFSAGSKAMTDSWLMISEMLRYLEDCDNCSEMYLPTNLFIPLRKAILSASRLPCVVSISRTPEVAFRFGWSPDFRPVDGYKCLTTTPVHHLQNPDVLRQFLFRINAVGWCTRKQFEETWMGLVGVLSATPIGQELYAVQPQETGERVCASGLAVRCLSSLLLQTLLTHPGNPQSSVYVLRHREQTSSCVDKNFGQRMVFLKGKLGRLFQGQLGKTSRRCFPGIIVVGNPERLHNISQYGHSQLSVETLWSLTGILAEERKLLAGPPGDVTEASLTPEFPINFTDRQDIAPPVVQLTLDPVDCKDLQSISLSTTVASTDPLNALHEERTDDGSDFEATTAQYQEAVVRPSSISSTPKTVQPPATQSPDMSSPTVRRSISNFLLTGESLPDVMSCLHFLLDLYSHWLSQGPDCVPISLLSATVESMILISDILSERAQYEWLREKLRQIYDNHFAEDELILQYLVLGLLKCAAVLGTDDVETQREVLDLIESSLINPQLSVRLAAIHGSLYLLQALTADQHLGLPDILSSYVTAQIGRSLLAPQQDLPTLEKPQNLQHQLALWALGFYLLRHFRDEHLQSNFMPQFLDLCYKVLATAGITVGPIYEAVIYGLESLLLASDLDNKIVADLVNLSTRRFEESCDPDTTIPVLGLLLSALYASKDKSESTGSRKDSSDTESKSQTPEPHVSAMEKLTLFLNKISTGTPEESEIIAAILPHFLVDNFNPGDLVNKLICEWLSPNQPRPRLVANIVHGVFQSLHEQETLFLVCDWALLSLPSFVHKGPLSFSIWSTTLFILSATANPWAKATFPLVLDREGDHITVIESSLFCFAVMNFRMQLKDASQIESLLSVLKSASIEHRSSPFEDAVRLLKNYV